MQHQYSEPRGIVAIGRRGTMEFWTCLESDGSEAAGQSERKQSILNLVAIKISHKIIRFYFKNVTSEVAGSRQPRFSVGPLSPEPAQCSSIPSFGGPSHSVNPTSFPPHIYSYIPILPHRPSILGWL